MNRGRGNAAQRPRENPNPAPRQAAHQPLAGRAFGTHRRPGLPPGMPTARCADRPVCRPPGVPTARCARRQGACRNRPRNRPPKPDRCSRPPSQQASRLRQRPRISNHVKIGSDIAGANVEMRRPGCRCRLQSPDGSIRHPPQTKQVCNPNSKNELHALSGVDRKLAKWVCIFAAADTVTGFLRDSR
jgi:hypothetical protein